MRYDGGYGRQAAAGPMGRGFDPRFAEMRPAQRGYDAGFGGGEEGLFGPARYGLGPYHQRLRKRQRPDAELKSEVEEALFFDTWVDAEAITVEVRNGIVTLRGELPAYDEVRYATDDAWDVDGVQGVRSELTVNTARRRPLDHVGGSQRGGTSGIGTS
jgi:hypothetical protein